MVAAVAALHWMHSKRSNPTVVQAYADPNSCARCHATEAAGYASTGMAHAFYRPQAKDTVESPAKASQFFHEASGSSYSMTERGGKYFQRRWQQGFDGKPENVEELQIDYVMGSGNHVRTYLHQEEDGTLIELPLAWYAEQGGHWGMNPGYDNPHPMTRRPIAYECMFCHNAYPERIFLRVRCIAVHCQKGLTANVATAPERIKIIRIHTHGCRVQFRCSVLQWNGPRLLQRELAKTAP
jgi:hypothetical protein